MVNAQGKLNDIRWRQALVAVVTCHGKASFALHCCRQSWVHFLPLTLSTPLAHTSARTETQEEGETHMVFREPGGWGLGDLCM